MIVHTTTPPKPWNDPSSDPFDTIDLMLVTARADKSPLVRMFCPAAIMGALRENVLVKENFPELIEKDAKAFFGMAIIRRPHPEYSEREVVLVAEDGGLYVICRVLADTEAEGLPDQSVPQSGRVSRQRPKSRSDVSEALQAFDQPDMPGVPVGETVPA